MLNYKRRRRQNTVAILGDPIGDALRSDAVAYWKMEEASGTRIDATGGGNDLAPTNAPGNTTGKVGDALSLAMASSQKVSRASTADLRLGGGDFLITCWLKVNGTINDYEVRGAVCKIGAVQPDYLINVARDEDLPYFYAAIGMVDAPFQTFVFSDELADVTIWHFIAFWFDLSLARIYLQIDNGATIYTGDLTLVAENGTSDFLIGNDNSIGFWNGAIDEVAIFKPADISTWWSQDKKNYLYNSGDGRTLYP